MYELSEVWEYSEIGNWLIVISGLGISIVVLDLFRSAILLKDQKYQKSFLFDLASAQKRLNFSLFAN